MPPIVGDRTGHRVLPGMGDSTAHRLGSTAPSAAIGDVRLRLLGERPGNLASGFEVDLDGVAGPRVRDHARAFQSNGRPCVLPRTLRGDGCPSVRAVTSAPRNAGRVAETVFSRCKIQNVVAVRDRHGRQHAEHHAPVGSGQALASGLPVARPTALPAADARVGVSATRPPEKCSSELDVPGGGLRKSGLDRVPSAELLARHLAGAP